MPNPNPTYRVRFATVDGQGTPAAIIGTDADTLDQARTVARDWVVNGVMPGIRALLTSPPTQRQATIDEVRPVETVGPEVIDLGPGALKVVRALDAIPD